MNTMFACLKTYKLAAGILLLIIACAAPASAPQYRYAVAISSRAYADPAWKTVADSLLSKHNQTGTAAQFIWSSSITDIRTSLSDFRPDYIGYIARPVSECNAEFVVTVSTMSRELDADPYGDAVWGIITGYEAADALRAISDSLTVRTVVAASANLSYEPPIRRFHQAIGMTCDSYTKTDYLFADRNGEVYSEQKRPQNQHDRINLVGSWLNAQSIRVEVPGQGSIQGAVDCIITGGHGNVNAWQCHYPEAGTEGFMQSQGGKLYGVPYSGNPVSITAATPKIYWCASNCLMGNPDSKDNIVYAAFHSGRAVQMFGFVNNASSGNEFMAWGVYDRVTKRAGTHTLPEAFFLSNNNALFEILNPTGLINANRVRLFMDSTVFYGDPAGNVTFQDFGDSAKAYTTDIVFNQDESGRADFSFTYTMRAHDLEYGTGYCYQFRPVQRLPARLDPTSIQITRNDGNHAEITDNLLIWNMLSPGEKLAKGESKTLQWSANITDATTGVISADNHRVAKRSEPRLYVTSLKNDMHFRIDGVKKGEFFIRIVTPAGKLIHTLVAFSPGTGKQSFLIEKKLSSGIYYAVLTQKDVSVNSVIPVGIY
ncbi:MAG: hypothetical protein ACOCW2_03060 [Chitinivibrionales bacterium]